jgi:hypothetical protein
MQPAYKTAAAPGEHTVSIRGDRTGLGEVMLDGNRYFGSFPDETPPASQPGTEPVKARLLTPGLLAALAELDRELRSFLNETSSETSDGRSA